MASALRGAAQAIGELANNQMQPTAAAHGGC
jgi:hypothetical protein